MNEKIEKMKKISRVIKIISKIGSIISMIGIVAMIIGLATIPYIVRESKGELREYIEEHGEPISMRFFEHTEVFELKPILDNYSNTRISLSLMTILLMPIIGLTFSIYDI